VIAIANDEICNEFLGRMGAIGNNLTTTASELSIDGVVLVDEA